MLKKTLPPYQRWLLGNWSLVYRLSPATLIDNENILQQYIQNSLISEAIDVSIVHFQQPEKNNSKINLMPNYFLF